MGQVIQQDSTAVISVTSTSVITMAASVAQTIGGGQFPTPALTCTIGTSGAGGLDTGSIAANTLYYLYLVRASSVISLVASVNAVSPTGFAAFKRIGRASTGATSLWSAAGNNTTEDTGKVGQILSGMLSEAQFQAVHGSSWILADGRSVAGSNYALITGTTTVPDMRGVALRGKSNGRSDGGQNPDGDLALGTYQGDAMGSHNHSTLTGTRNNVFGGTGTNRGLDASGFTSNIQNIDYGTQSFSLGVSTVGSNESRMKNVTVNHFIKIN